jgi:hypothetical protein
VYVVEGTPEVGVGSRGEGQKIAGHGVCVANVRGTLSQTM